LTTLILASTSPRRHDLLSKLGLSFETARPDIDETPHPDEAPIAYVARLSREKAAAIAHRGRYVPDTCILSADTTVVENGEIIGKPADATDAIRILKRLRGHAHMGYTGVTLWCVGQPETQDQVQTRVIETRIVMRPYTDREIAAYVESGDPMGKAGSYAIQNADFHPVDHIEGCYTNVVGLPVCAVCAMLNEARLQVPHPILCSSENLPCQFIK
jgi:septum formation protein